MQPLKITQLVLVHTDFYPKSSQNHVGPVSIILTDFNLTTVLSVVFHYILFIINSFLKCIN